MEEFVNYNGYKCKILKIWNDYWYDLKTVEKSENGIQERFYSIELNELKNQGNNL